MGTKWVHMGTSGYKKPNNINLVPYCTLFFTKKNNIYKDRVMTFCLEVYVWNIYKK